MYVSSRRQLAGARSQVSKLGDKHLHLLNHLYFQPGIDKSQKSHNLIKYYSDQLVVQMDLNKILFAVEYTF